MYPAITAQTARVRKSTNIPKVRPRGPQPDLPLTWVLSEANSKYLKYLNLIADAQRDYKPCNRDRCGCHASVISQDLKMFKEKGISASSIQSVKAKQGHEIPSNQPQSVSRAKLHVSQQVLGHRALSTRSCARAARPGAHCEWNVEKLLPCSWFTPALLQINTRDWPQIPKNYGFFGPVFSFSKTSEYNDIMYPAWAFWEGGPAISLYPRGIGRWDVHRKELGKLGNSSKWEEKIPKAFFRGSRTCSERDALILLSREKPELADAQYTKNQAWKSEADTLHVAPAQEVSFEEHCQYKYLFNFRGVAASFRLKHILLCKSVVFHVGNEWQEFFYPALKPWIHYIPVDSSASKEQLQELIEFASHHDDVVREIAENGYKMIWNHLRMKDVSCYWRKLLKKYASLQTFKPSRDEMLVEIKG
ncbi:hypothetical protein YQE_03976, partial [Dendroctonus ponderosae]